MIHHNVVSAAGKSPEKFLFWTSQIRLCGLCGFVAAASLPTPPEKNRVRLEKPRSILLGFEQENPGLGQEIYAPVWESLCCTRRTENHAADLGFTLR
jgi:hypothetical protein